MYYTHKTQYEKDTEGTDVWHYAPIKQQPEKRSTRKLESIQKCGIVEHTPNPPAHRFIDLFHGQQTHASSTWYSGCQKIWRSNKGQDVNPYPYPAVPPTII